MAPTITRRNLKRNEYLCLKTLKRRLQFVFIKFKISGDFDDFFQTYCLEYYAGLHQGQTLDQFAIDYLRKLIGRNGKKAHQELVMEFDAQRDSASSEEEKHSVADLKAEINKLEGRHRTIAGLFLLYGFSTSELAFLLDVTESRVHQIVTDITHKIRKSSRWVDDRTLSLPDIEQAAKILGVPVLWLRQKLDELH